jgi:hypothetical protein
MHTSTTQHEPENEMDQIRTALDALCTNGKEFYVELLKSCPAEVVAQAMDVYADLMADNGESADDIAAYVALANSLAK